MAQDGGLFSGLTFAIDPHLPQALIEQIEPLLTSNGAIKAYSDENAACIISNSVYKGYDEKSVSPEFVFRSCALSIAQEPRFFLSSPTAIFSGCTVTCAADVPVQDAEIYYAAVLAFGGQYRPNLTKETTHFLTLGEKDEIFTRAVGYRSGKYFKVCHTMWLEDCITYARKVEETSFRFPDPSVLHYQPYVSRPVVGSIKELEIASVVQDDFAEKVPEESESRVLFPKKFLLETEVASETLRSSLVHRIEALGGIVLQPTLLNVLQTDYVVCKYRHGDIYNASMLHLKRAASVHWLFHIFSTGVLTDPMSELMHYPRPFGPAAGFEELKITCSNYTGTCREYIKKIISELGAEYTPSMSSANTHLITAAGEGAKYDKSAIWGVKAVNHIWLEQCFISWSAVVETQPAFMTWTPGVDLQTQVGSVSLPEKSLRKWKDTAEANRMRIESLINNERESGSEETEQTHLQAPTKTSENISQTQRSSAVSRHTADAEVFKQIAEQAQCAVPKALNEQKIDNNEDEKDVDMTDSIVLKNLEANSRPVDHAQRPVAHPISNPGHGNDENSNNLAVTPARNSVNSAILNSGGSTSRKAAIKASAATHESALDMLNFANEQKNESARKRRKTESAAGSSPIRKASQLEKIPVVHVKAEPKVKKGASEINVRSLPHIMTTGYTLSSAEIKAMTALNCKLVDSAKSANILVAKGITRTEKFLSAIGLASHIVSVSWIKDCVSKKSLLPCENYTIHDKAMEKSYQFSLSKSMSRAKSAKLLKDFTFFITPGIPVQFDILERVISAHGGSAKAQKSDVLNLSKRKGTIYRLISCAEDKKIYGALLSRYGDVFGKVAYDNEYILQGILKQELRDDENMVSLTSNLASSRMSDVPNPKLPL